MQAFRQASCWFCHPRVGFAAPALVPPPARWLRRIGFAAQSTAPKSTAVLALETSFADLTRKVVALEEELKVTKTEVATWSEKMRSTIQMPQSDPALDAFDRLCLKRVETDDHDTASTFLAKFQFVAAQLKPNERIELKVIYLRESNIKLLEAVLADPQANKIYSLRWVYDGYEDVNSVIPLLTNNCLELASLSVYFVDHSEFDFVSSMLKHPYTKIKVLYMSSYRGGDLARFFVALRQSQVSAIDIYGSDSLEFAQGLCKYLARDLLVRLKIWMNRVPSAMPMSLAKCTRLVELKLTGCEFSQPIAFTLSKSITKLELKSCRFVDGFDWSFLASSNVRELNLDNVRGANGNQLGDALAVHLRTKGLNKLCLYNCDFVNETLAAVGVELGRIKILDLSHNDLSDASIKLIALALQVPKGEMKELALWYTYPTVSSIDYHLAPTLQHPNCNLDKLLLGAYAPWHGAAAKTMEDQIRNRRVLLAL